MYIPTITLLDVFVATSGYVHQYARWLLNLAEEEQAIKCTTTSLGICYNTQVRRFLRMEDTAYQESRKPS